MGGKESTPGKQNTDETPKVNHPRFQNIKFTRNKEDEDCIQVKLPLASMKEYNQWEQQLKDMPTQTQNFLLPISRSFTKQGFCGSSGFVNILFQNFPYVLADQIRNRSCLKQKFFDEPELWYLIYTLISAGHEFHKTGRKVGDVRPENVFINEDGQVKVATHLTWPSENTNYYKTIYQKQLTYLSPQQLKDIQFGKMQPSCDPKLAESFSVGLTCLDAGTLSSSNYFYLKSHKFDYEYLKKKLQELQNAGYSQILCLVVNNLCQADSDRRSTCTELYNWLQPYQQSIISLQRFQVSSLPQKLAHYNLGQQHQSPQRQSGAHFTQSVNPSINSSVIPGQVPPQPNQQFPAYYGRATDLTYTQNSNPINEYHYTLPPQPQGGQTVTYIQPPPGVQIVNQPIPIPSQSYQPAQPYVVMPVVDQTSKRTTYTYTSQYPSSQFQGNLPPPQVVSGGPPIGVLSGQTVYSQNVQYVKGQPSTIVSTTGTNSTTGNNTNTASTNNINTYQGAGTSLNTGQGTTQRQKSTMELTLQKIDEQLQMSRKMFPS